MCLCSSFSPTQEAPSPSSQADLTPAITTTKVRALNSQLIFCFVAIRDTLEHDPSYYLSKLYLDAVVIQQGRLAQQNTKLSKVCGVGCAHGMGAL